MPDMFSRAMSKDDPFDQARAAIEWMKLVYPCLHDVLAGYRSNGTGIDRLPGSLRLFTNGGELKAELTGPDWLMRGYLVVPKGLLTIEAIEEEIKAQRIGWSVKTERTDNLKRVPY